MGHEQNILALAKSAEMVKFLLGQLTVHRERVVNGGDEHGFTALHIAAMDGKKELCRALIDGGADAFAKVPLSNPIMKLFKYELFNPLQIAYDQFNEKCEFLCKYDEDQYNLSGTKFKLKKTIKYLRSHMKSELAKKAVKKGKRK